MGPSTRTQKALKPPDSIEVTQNDEQNNEDEQVHNNTNNMGSDDDTNADNEKQNARTEESIINSIDEPTPSEEEESDDWEFWDGIMPSPSSNIGHIANQRHNDDQAQDAQDLYNYMNTKDPDLSRLNTQSKITPMLLSVPGTRTMRIVYGIGSGLGTNGLAPSIVDDEILILQGDKDNDNAPSVMTLPPQALAKHEMKMPSKTQIETALQQSNLRKKQHWFTQAAITTTAQSNLIVPIPTFLVSDHFNTDIDTAVLIERLHFTIGIKSLQVLKSALALCYGSLVKPTTKLTSEFPTSMFINCPHEDTIKWKKLRTNQLFQSMSTPLPPTPSKTTTPTDTTNILSPEIIKAIAEVANKATGSTSAVVTPDKADKADEYNGYSKSAFEKLLIMCGLTMSTKDELPQLWTQLQEKNLTTSDKHSIIRHALANATKYKGAKIPPLSSLITTIAKRNFEGDTSMSSLLTAVQGLTPFAVPLLTELEIDAHNQQADAIYYATMTSISDLKSNKIKATIPKTFDKMIKHLKVYANLIFALFGDLCPLLDALEEVIDDFENYNETSRTATTAQSIASSFWIIMLQSRHFAEGNMTGKTTFLPSFTNMTNNIKICSTVYHGAVPASLYMTPSNEQSKKRNSPTIERKENTKQKTTNGDRTKVLHSDIYNNKMETAMKPFMAMQRRPTIGNLCKASGTRPSELFPNRKDICIRTQLWGLCDSECTHEHIKLPDAEINKCIQLLKKAIDKPSSVPKVNN
jgi:hypothetical protein